MFPANFLNSRSFLSSRHSPGVTTLVLVSSLSTILMVCFGYLMVRRTLDAGRQGFANGDRNQFRHRLYAVGRCVQQLFINNQLKIILHLFSAVHYEKTRINLRQMSVIKAKRHSFIPNGIHLDAKHIHLKILHIHKHLIAFLGIHLHIWTFE